MSKKEKYLLLDRENLTTFFQAKDQNGFYTELESLAFYLCVF